MNYFDSNSALLNDVNVAALLANTKASVPFATDKDDQAFSFLLPNEALILVMGFGDGMLVDRVARNMKSYHHMIIFEPDIASFKGALQRRTFKKLFTNKSVRIVLGVPVDYGWIQMYQHTITNGVLMVFKSKDSLNSSYAKQHKEFYDKFIEYRAFSEINTGTQLRLGKAFANSILENAPTLVKSPGILNLKNMFKGSPCILVSAGPSLENDLDELRKAKGKALIITVDAALPFLLQNDIIPDIITGIDPLKDNEALYKDKRALSIPAIVIAQYTPTVMSKLKHPFVAGMPGNPIYDWLSRCWPDKGGIDVMGGSVSCFAYQVAEYLGCSSVAFLGLDLSFRKKYHVGNVATLLHEHMGLEVPDDTISGVPIKSRGKWVYTRETLLTFKTAFENRFTQHPIPTPINCTKGGLKIAGTTEMSLKSYVKRYGLKTTGDYATWLVEHKGNAEGDTTKLSDEVNKLYTIFSGISNAAKKIIPIIHEIKAIRDKGKNEGIHPKIKKIEALRKLTQHPVLSLIIPYHYQLEIYMRKREVREIDNIKGRWKKLDSQIDRGLNFYGELVEAVDLFNVELKAMLKHMKKRKEVIRENVHERHIN